MSTMRSDNWFKYQFKRLLSFIYKELHEEGAYLVPLRIFIGIGWIRAGTEKILEPEYRNGHKLEKFFDDQIAEGLVRFPFYEDLINDVFYPNAEILIWIIIIGQFLAGLSILTGTFTNLGLSGGIFMNFNFVLAGAVNPSAFYIVIQQVLFISNVGSTMGVDTFLSKKIKYSFLVAQDDYKRNYLLAEKVSFLLLGLASFGLAGFAFFYIEDFSPNSVDDPAMLLFILGQLGGLALIIDYIRLQPSNAQAPKISQPRDIIFTHGKIGKAISWELVHPNPDIYVITENDEILETNSWESGQKIVYNVDHLSIGYHRITITATDWYGNSGSDAVDVIVLDPLQEKSIGILQLLQYYREELEAKIVTYQHEMAILDQKTLDYRSALTKMDENTSKAVGEKYGIEISRITERKQYIENSIKDAEDLLAQIDGEQVKETHHHYDELQPDQKVKTEPETDSI